MKREIAKACTEFKPEEIVVIVGAYHLLGIQNSLPAMTDDELKKAPQSYSAAYPDALFVFAPQQSYGLRSGQYGALLLELMWRAMQNNTMVNLPLPISPK